MCKEHGIQCFEIAHLFTQWGAKHAPKIMATVDGEYRKIFGWETDSLFENMVLQGLTKQYNYDKIKRINVILKKILPPKGTGVWKRIQR